MMIIYLAPNYKYYTVSLQMRLIYEQLTPLGVCYPNDDRKEKKKSEKEREKILCHNTPPEETISIICHIHLRRRQL